MPLQQLIHYFNDRFETEHHSNIRPFILEKSLVSGIFGPIQISSVFEPVRQTDDNETLIGHIAQLSVTPYDNNQNPWKSVIYSRMLLPNLPISNPLLAWIACAVLFTC